MKDIVFRSEAETDLRAILAYYEDVAPHVVAEILEDINRSLALLQRHPFLGAPVAKRPFRRIVTRRYHFKIAYLDEPERLVILGLFRFQNRER